MKSARCCIQHGLAFKRHEFIHAVLEITAIHACQHLPLAHHIPFVHVKGFQAPLILGLTFTRRMASSSPLAVITPGGLLCVNCEFIQLAVRLFPVLWFQITPPPTNTSAAAAAPISFRRRRFMPLSRDRIAARPD